MRHRHSVRTQLYRLKFLFSRGCIMDYDFPFRRAAKKIFPYDMDAYLKSGRFVLVATNCLTGKAAYFDTPRDIDDLLLKCRASCSLPFACPMVEVGGVPMLDGGIADALPIRRAQSDGYEKCVVVLTRNKGYRKNEKFSHVPRFIYPKYPELRRALASKNARYNRSLYYIEELERAGKVVVIRPESPLKVNPPRAFGETFGGFVPRGIRLRGARLGADNGTCRLRIGGALSFPRSVKSGVGRAFCAREIFCRAAKFRPT